MPTKTKIIARPVDDRATYTRDYLQYRCMISWEELCEMRASGIVKTYGKGRRQRFRGKEINEYWTANPR